MVMVPQVHADSNRTDDCRHRDRRTFWVAAMKFWKEIKTAPRDGTVIIVYRPGAKHVVGIDHWVNGRGWWRSQPHLPPTHWCNHRDIRPASETSGRGSSADVTTTMSAVSEALIRRLLQFQVGDTPCLSKEVAAHIATLDAANSSANLRTPLPARGEWQPWQEYLHQEVYAVAVRITGDQPQASEIADAALRTALTSGKPQTTESKEGRQS